MSNSGDMDEESSFCRGQWLQFIELRAESSHRSSWFHPYTDGRGEQYKRLHRTRSAPSLVRTEVVPLNAHHILDLLECYAMYWSDFPTIVGKCLRNVQIKFSKISQNIEAAFQLDQWLVMDGVHYAISIIESVKHIITRIETDFIPNHIKKLTILRGQLMKAAAAASGPSVIDSSPCSQFGPVINVPGYARDWNDYLYGNVHISAVDMHMLLSDYTKDWSDLNLNIGKFVNNIEFNEIWHTMEACLDTDEQSKNLILGGFENAISRIEAMKNVKIVTSFIGDHLKQLTNIRDSLKARASISPLFYIKFQ